MLSVVQSDGEIEVHGVAEPCSGSAVFPLLIPPAHSGTASRRAAPQLPPAKVRRTRSRFTLIELLVVIAIIAVLAAMLLPSLGRAKDMAKVALCQSHQRQLLIGLTTYADSHDGFLPPNVYPWPSGNDVWGMQVVEDAWGTVHPRGLGLLVSSGILDFSAMRTLWCPGFRIDSAASDASRYSGFLAALGRNSFGPSGFNDYTWSPHIYRDRSDAADDGRLNGKRLTANPQIIADGGFALMDGTAYWNQWPTYCGGMPHAMAGVNFGFVDGRVTWMPMNKLIRNCANYHYAPNLSRHAPWLWPASYF